MCVCVGCWRRWSLWTDRHMANQCLAQGLWFKTIQPPHSLKDVLHNRLAECASSYKFWLYVVHIVGRCRVENGTGNVFGWRISGLTQPMNKIQDVFITFLYCGDHFSLKCNLALKPNLIDRGGGWLQSLFPIGWRSLAPIWTNQNCSAVCFTRGATIPAAFCRRANDGLCMTSMLVTCWHLPWCTDLHIEQTCIPGTKTICTFWC